MTTRAACGKLAVNFIARKVATDAIPVNPHFSRARKSGAAPPNSNPHSGGPQWFAVQISCAIDSQRDTF
jgi:hypothetical protein